MSVKSDVFDKLKEIILKNYRIFCVGSELRSDDRVGLYICDRLKEKGLNNVFRCDYGLENCFNELSNSEKALIIDAISNDLSPGTIVLIDEKAVVDLGLTLSTHAIPITKVIELAKSLGKLKDVKILGIGVKSLDIGTELSESVRKAAEAIIDLILNVKLKDKYKRS